MVFMVGLAFLLSTFRLVNTEDGRASEGAGSAGGGQLARAGSGTRWAGVAALWLWLWLVLSMAGGLRFRSIVLGGFLFHFDSPGLVSFYPEVIDLRKGLFGRFFRLHHLSFSAWYTPRPVRLNRVLHHAT
jgi:hypothetical protein